MEAAHAAWLAGRTEEPIDAAQRICDPHHHLWDHPTDTYLLDELHADTGAGHHVVSTVFVECLSAYRKDGPDAMRPVGETEFVARLADASDQRDGAATIAGIVGFADLTLGSAVADVLAAHVDAGGGRFRGIRHASGWDASDAVRSSHTRTPEHLLDQPAFREGCRALANARLHFEAWMYHPQLPELVDLARELPELPIVLDHLGGPLGIGSYAGRRDEVRDDWRASMQHVAACPNVTLKLGGIGMPIFGLDWHRRSEPPSSESLAAAWSPDVEWCITTFGVERCMFESNFPVDRRSCSYTVLWNAFQRIADSCGAAADERDALFHDNAARIYRLA